MTGHSHHGGESPGVPGGESQGGGPEEGPGDVWPLGILGFQGFRVEGFQGFRVLGY